MSSNLIARSIFCPGMKAGDLWNLPEDCTFRQFFNPEAKPWDWLPQISKSLSCFDFPATNFDVPVGLSINGDVFIASNVSLPPYGVIEGPVYIGSGSELRPGVYIRGNVIVGRDCVLGNSSEYKNCLLLDGVQTPHYNYVGDSILGNKAHLGAGAILSNLRLDQGEVVVKTAHGSMRSGLRKLGGLLGDAAEVGCNTVLQPGTILGPRSAVFPGIAFGGYLGAGKLAAAIHEVRVMERPG